MKGFGIQCLCAAVQVPFLLVSCNSHRPVIPEYYSNGKFYVTDKKSEHGKLQGAKMVYSILDEQENRVTAFTQKPGEMLPKGMKQVDDDKVLNREQFVQYDKALKDLDDVLALGDHDNPQVLAWGKPLPGGFALKDLEGRVWTQDSLIGRVTVVNAWFSTCAPCLKEFPILSQWKDTMPDVTFLSVCYQDRETVERVTSKRGFNWTHLYGDTYFCSFLNGQGYPMFVVIDKNGKVRYMGFGASEDTRSRVLKYTNECLR